MPRKNNFRTKPQTNCSASLAPAVATESAPSSLTADQVIRWAELVAAGRSELPSDLSPPDLERLEAAVRKLLKQRMVGLIARAIAADIVRDGQGS